MQNIIYEYSEVKDEDLKKHIEDTPSLHKYFKLEWGKLKARQYCGIINFNENNYYILPKISKKDKESNLNIFIYIYIYIT